MWTIKCRRIIYSVVGCLSALTVGVNGMLSISFSLCVGDASFLLQCIHTVSVISLIIYVVIHLINHLFDCALSIFFFSVFFSSCFLPKSSIIIIGMVDRIHWWHYFTVHACVCSVCVCVCGVCVWPVCVSVSVCARVWCVLQVIFQMPLSDLYNTWNTGLPQLWFN